ncbi:hypothetical protein [Enterococcus sp. AZ163]|uniref:hypothetical protein n=1 Tax=Enterococcus sp. AZ163 TaxID=2774638 RepID=UPI003D294B51
MSKEKHPFEYLTDDQLDDFLDYSEVPFTGNNTENIKKQFHNKKSLKPRKRSSSKRIAVFAIAAASIMFLTAFTFRDELRLIYQKHFGSEIEVLLANSDRLEQEVEDQGLRLKAISSFKDGNTTYFISQLTDLTGNRLADDTQLESWQMLNGGNSRVVDYDQTTKTATLLTQAVEWDEGIKPGYFLESFTSHREDFQETYSVPWQEIPQSDNWQKRAATEGFGGGDDPKAMERLSLDFDELAKTYLIPAESLVELGKYAAVSAVGFKDGLLHLQTKEINTVGSATFISLKNRTNGKVLSEIASFSVDAGTHNNETGRSDYSEHLFEIDKKDLVDYDLQVEGFESQTHQKGNWAIQLEEPKQLPAKELADQAVTINGQQIRLQNIRLSPISLSFNHVGALNDAAVEIMLKDGTTKEINLEYQQENDYYEWQFGLIDLDTVKAVKINDQELKLN